MQPQVLLITPPFTQLNTPYPATAYLKGFLQQHQIACSQCDLSLTTILQLFSKEKLETIFSLVDIEKLSASGRRFYSLRKEYLSTIDIVIQFLQGKSQSLAQRIADEGFLPKGDHFFIETDLEWAFGHMGFRDKARHFCTLYLEDIAQFITQNIDPHFGFSRYAEQLGRYAGSFQPLQDQLEQEPTLIDQIMIDELKRQVEQTKPNLVAITIPFPGNLYSALRCGQWLKQHHPSIHIVMGGGFVNTELRSLTDPGIFQYTDFLILDDGEAPFLRLIDHLYHQGDKTSLMRTYLLEEGLVRYCNDENGQDIPFDQIACPDYSDLPHAKYLSVIEVLNPMHKLWSDGYWNKITLAHGCYWGKCAFCDGTLDYIKRYDPSSARQIVDHMQQMIQQTGETGFHFVDEAAPPKLLREVAIEILRRNLKVTWWGNIRFEKSFTADLCRLLAASGCIAVSGGLEIASERVLKLINKGVTVDQVARVAHHFSEAGVLVHAYLMYGFPTQTAQETIDALENVRQLFQMGVVQSAFWHRFAMTAHSPVGADPAAYQVQPLDNGFKGFADNDRLFQDPLGTDHAAFGEGLRKSLFNYLHGVGLDFPLSDWFSMRVPKTTVPPNRIYKAIQQVEPNAMHPQRQVIWIGGEIFTRERVSRKKGKERPVLDFTIHNKTEEITFSLPLPLGRALQQALHKMSLDETSIYRLSDLEKDLTPVLDKGLNEFFYTEQMKDLRDTSLLIL